MPLPIILGIGAAVAGVAGITSGVKGAAKMKEASETQEYAKELHEKSQKRFESANTSTNKAMDEIGELELRIMKSFEQFSDLIEKIHNRPEFKEINSNGVSLPDFTPEKLREVSVGAGVLLGGLGGAAVGTAGGFAAAGATTAAVMALGTASTGTAIASLSGAAATNATLAALGGGALAAGGGGMALGSMILGASTLGVGLLVGGFIFNATGSKLSDKADEAYYQAKREEEKVDKICKYLDELKKIAGKYKLSLMKVKQVYDSHMASFDLLVNTKNKTDWLKYSDEEKLLVENTYLLVALLYGMCKVQLVLKSENENEMNSINNTEISKSMNDAETILRKVA